MTVARPAPARDTTTRTHPVRPAVPPARRHLPGGRDLRLALGVVLVLASVVLGARLISAADDRTEVWALAGPLSAGTTLTAEDVVPVAVALEDLGPYVGSGTDVEGRVLTRGELLENVWGYTFDTSTRTLDTFIHRLRKYFEPDHHHPRHLHTVRGVGYRFTFEPEV